MMSNHYSDLQTVASEEQPKYYLSGPRDSSTDLPQPVPYSDKIAVKSYTLARQTSTQRRRGQEQPSERGHSQERHKRICGLKERLFWTVFVVVAIIVVAAAVGGGIGGSYNKRKSNAAGLSSSSTASTLSSTMTAIPASSVTISTTTIVGPSQTLLSDCPSSNNTIYSAPSTSQSFRKLCGDSFLRVNGTDNCINQQAPSLDACIGLCAAYNVQYAADIASSARSVCSSVCWRATIVGDDFPGQCYGFTTFNRSGTFARSYDDRCNSAALIDQ